MVKKLNKTKKEDMKKEDINPMDKDNNPDRPYAGKYSSGRSKSVRKVTSIASPKNEEVKEPTGGLKKACWKGYTAVGMKEKNDILGPRLVSWFRTRQLILKKEIRNFFVTNLKKQPEIKFEIVSC